jgi:hypothetical protein
MSRIATKAANNEFYKARMNAASCNERLASREGASEETGIDRTRLARIELGSINAYPEEVLIMADVYNAPELCNSYCSRDCPIGRQIAVPCELLEFDRMMLKAAASLQDAENIYKNIISIAADGKITPDEQPKMESVIEYMKCVGAAAEEMQLWIRKHKEER